MAQETYRQLGDTSVYVNAQCQAQVGPLEGAQSQIPLTQLSCEGPCFLASRKMVFGVPLNAPQGDVSDTHIRSAVELACPLQVEPLPTSKSAEPAPTTADAAPLPPSIVLAPSQAAAL